MREQRIQLLSNGCDCLFAGNVNQVVCFLSGELVRHLAPEGVEWIAVVGCTRTRCGVERTDDNRDFGVCVLIWIDASIGE